MQLHSLNGRGRTPLKVRPLPFSAILPFFPHGLPVCLFGFLLNPCISWFHSVLSFLLRSLFSRFCSVLSFLLSLVLSLVSLCSQLSVFPGFTLCSAFCSAWCFPRFHSLLSFRFSSGFFSSCFAFHSNTERGLLRKTSGSETPVSLSSKTAS